MSEKSAIQKFKAKAYKFCAYRERSPKELLEKLSDWGAKKDDAESILKELKTENFLDEQRFANAFCNDKFEFNSWGKNKIRAQISAHHLPKNVLEIALDRIDEEKYFNRIKELAHKKWELLPISNKAIIKKQKTLNYLSSKGFESNLIWKVLNEFTAKD